MVAEHPDPVPGSGHVLVRVHAAGINGADLHQLRGNYPAPPGSPPDIPGLELAGEVVELGPDTIRFNVGDRVMAIVGGGGQAELAVVHERQLMPVPEPLDWTQAGGAPEVFTTAHDALITQSHLTAGEHLLVHGGAGGVGTAAIQLGAAAGARVTATVRNASLHDQVAALGADVVAPDDFVARGPFDVILELVGAPNMADNVNSVAVGGRISVIGIGAGAKADVHLGVLMGKLATLRGSVLRYRPLEGKAATARAMEREVLPLFESRRIHVPVSETFPLDEVAGAYERFAAGGKLGKIVVLTS